MDPFNLAVLTHDMNTIKSFLKKENVDVRDRAGRTPLLNAVIEDSLPMVKLLIEHGANIQIQDKKGWSVLHFASQNQSAEMVKFLIEQGANVDAVDTYGNTPLLRAVFSSRGHGEVIQVLLRAGANRDRENSHGISPLKLAHTISNYDVKQFFE